MSYMKNMRFLCLVIIGILCFSLPGKAQTDVQHGGWIMLLNNTKITQKWGFYADMQVRSTDDFKKVKNLMFRPGITYYLNSKNEFTLGYLFNDTYVFPAEEAEYSLTEHRIWEQYVLKHKLKAVAVNHRFRLEQRFIARYDADDLFSQRFRYFIRFIIPLQKGMQNFEKGPFAALQNEIFLNLQNKDQLNTHTFDQNRAYGAAGYRFSPKLDIEAGYLNQSSKGKLNNSVNHVIQIAVYTRF